MKILYTTLIIFLTLLSPLVGQVNVNASLSPDSLAYEFDILEKAYRELHPGLYRFQEELAINQLFEATRSQYIQSQNLQEAFLTLQEFTTKIQCGHTYPNFWNQRKTVQESLFNQADKLPFTFIIVQDQFLIQQNVSNADIPNHSLIIAINGVSTEEIIQKLFEYSRADGANDLKRIHELYITGKGKFETFDIYFPMLFPPQNGTFNIATQDFNGNMSNFEVKAISRKERKERLAERFALEEGSLDDTWEFNFLDEKTAYLRLGTFAIWQMELDWKAFLKDSFQQLATTQIENLIIDIRGNEGGMAEVWWELLSYLTDESLDLVLDKKLIRYQKVSEDIQPFVGSWEEGLLDISEMVQPYDERFFEARDPSLDSLHVEPSTLNFQGKVVILTDAANSSATFYLSKYSKENHLATLVGQTTGGNLMGTNGGSMFFLNLPYTGLEVDLPLIGYYPRQSLGNKGLKPDEEVSRDLDFYLSEEDEDIQKAMEIFEKPIVTVSESDFEQMIADNWTGELIYVDFGTGKEVTIPCELSVQKVASNTFDLNYSFPDEPHANWTDREKITKRGQVFAHQKVLNITQEGQKTIIKTSKWGSDDNREATLFYTYTIGQKELKIKKEYQLVGENVVNFRNEFRFTK